jgi:hypothetical protein
MRLSFNIVTLLSLALLLSGCEDGPFDLEAAQGAIEGTMVALTGEQVMVTYDQVTCGAKKGLWSAPQTGGGLARLTAAGSQLNFSDDVRLSDQHFTQPVVQLRGNFRLKVLKLVAMKDESPNAKIVEAQLGAVIDHECFGQPLTLLGIDRGTFSQDTNPRVRLRLRGDWVPDAILH